MSAVTLTPTDVNAAAARLRASLPPLHDALAAADVARERAVASVAADAATAMRATGRAVDRVIAEMASSVTALALGLEAAAADLADQDGAMGGRRALPSGRVQ